MAFRSNQIRLHLNNSEPLSVTPLPPIKFQCNLRNIWKEMLFGEFQECHLGVSECNDLTNSEISRWPPAIFKDFSSKPSIFKTFSTNTRKCRAILLI